MKMKNKKKKEMDAPELRAQEAAAAVHTGRSFSVTGGILSMGLLSKKFTGFRSKLADTVGITGKSSWQGT